MGTSSVFPSTEIAWLRSRFDEVGDLTEERCRLRLQHRAAGVEEDPVGQQPDDQTAPR